MALRAVVPNNAETEGSTTYWYKSKAIAKHPSITYHYAASNDSYYYNSYTSAFLQADGQPVKLYTTPTNAIANSGKHVTLSSIFKKVAVRWDEKYDKQDVLYIRVNGKTYYVVDTADIQSSNSWKTGTTISSPYAPTSTSKIVLRRGDKVASATTWHKVIHYGKGTRTVASWHKNKGIWVKNK